MASGKITFQLVDIEAEPVRYLPCVLVTRQVADLLRGAGYSPDDFNVAKWPLGMRFHGEASLLVTRAALRTFAESNAPGENIVLRMGVGSETVDISDLTIIDITPIILTEMSTRALEGGNGLFRVTVADARWKAYSLDSSVTFDSFGTNVRGDDRGRIWNGASASSFDAALSAALTFISASITDAWSGGGSAPVDIPAACPYAEVVDRLCTETGRVLVPKLDGTFAVEYWDKHPVQSWLSAYSDRILAGGAEWRLGTIGDDYLDAVTLLQSKSRRGCPEVVVVRFMDWGQSGRGDQPWRAFSSSVTATSSGLTAHRARTMVWDRLPLLGTTNLSEIAARANEVGAAYFRRFLAGECDVVLSGCVSPPMGGGAQIVEWRASEAGFTTRVKASVDHPLLIAEDHRLRTIGGGAAGAVCGLGANDEAVVVTTRDELVYAEIAEVNISVSPNPANVTYTVRGRGGESLGPFAENLSPRFRTFIGSSVIITPAEVGDPCIIAYGGYETSPQIGRRIELLATTESVTVQTCGGVDPPRPPPSISIDAPITDKRGDLVSDHGGNVIVSKMALPGTESAWNAAITGKHGEVLSGKTGAILSTKYGEGAIQSLIDAVVTDKYGSPMADHHGRMIGNKQYA